MSFVPPEFSFEPWTVYAGIPIASVRPRNRESVLRQTVWADHIQRWCPNLAES